MAECKHLGQPTQAYGVGTATAGPFMCPWCEIDNLRSDLAQQAETIERPRAALERVLHYWQERYGMEFQKTDEALIDEVRRVQKALHSAAEPKPLPTESVKAAPGVMDVLELQAKTDAAVAGLNAIVKCPTCGMGYFKHPMQD